jgi:hypothetical protein
MPATAGDNAEPGADALTAQCVQAVRVDTRQPKKWGLRVAFIGRFFLHAAPHRRGVSGTLLRIGYVIAAAAIFSPYVI